MDYGSVELTEQSINHFTAHMRIGPTDWLVSLLQGNLAKNGSYQQLCIKYLIGSVAVLGKADECALGTFRKLCKGKKISCLSELLDKLTQQNDLDAAAQFVAENLGSKGSVVFMDLVAKLLKEDWGAMERLAMKALAVLKRCSVQNGECHFMLRHFPIELQYEMINTGEISLDMISPDHYGGGSDPLLREIFFLARGPHVPNPQLRQCIASRFPYYGQFLADRTAERTTSLCPDSIPTLSADIWAHISKFMDLETLAFMVPLVCKAWRSLHSKILTHDTRIHDLYTQDLSRVALSKIHAISPWKNCLLSQTNALRYLGRCIADGALDRTESTYWLQLHVKEYIEAVTSGRIPPPRTKGGAAQYDAFVGLFGKAYEFCTKYRLTLEKPIFLTDEEFEQAVHHFVYERKWILKLPESLIADKMPRLFEIIREDEELMRGLAGLNFNSSVGAPIALIQCGQADKVPDKLARLIFSHTGLLGRLSEPQLLPFHEHYNFIVETGVLPEVIEEGYTTIRFRQFLVSLILSFKDSPEKIEKIAASVISWFSGPNNQKLQDIKWWLGLSPFGVLMDFEGYSPDDIRFFNRVMRRCRLL